MIRKLSSVLAPVATGAALALLALPCQAVLDDFPRAGLRGGNGGFEGVLSSVDGAVPLQMAALGTTAAYGAPAPSVDRGAAALISAAPSADSSGWPSETLPLLGGLACIAGFMLARRRRP